jgi:cytochrome d ubiquinol oxidase subunit I
VAIGLLDQWLHSYPAGSDRVLSMIGIEIHWAILQYVLGLSFLAFVTRLIYHKTGNEHWERLTKTLAKGFILVFAFGAATGTASEFGLVLLWPNLTEAAGDFIYFPLYAEIFAFLMEVVFLYMLWYGWDRLPLKAHTAVILLGFLGAWYSASMIVSVNSYMVAPTGIAPAYDAMSGAYLYDKNYPKLELHVPLNLTVNINGQEVQVPALDINGDGSGVLNASLLLKAGVEVKGIDKEAGVVKVLMPVRIVQRLVFEAYHGYTIKESILQYVVSKAFIGKHQDVVPALLNVPVKDIVGQIVKKTVRDVGVYTVTFKSPVYRASIMHAIGAALTTSSFTVMAAYLVRYLQYREGQDKEYLEYVKSALRFSIITALTVIAIQGLVFGHEMGHAIAHYNPEKFAAMEATTNQVPNMAGPLKGFMHHTLMPFLAYGTTKVKLPSYDQIPQDYCMCQLSNVIYQQNPAIPSDADRGLNDCRPPLIIHYLYYTKIGLAILLGLYALLLTYYLWRSWSEVRIPGWAAWLGYLVIPTVHIVSFFGWAVREIGRKPWTIYGVMTPETAHTVNPASTGEVALVAIYLLTLIGLLAYGVYRILWKPGNPGESH